MNSEFIRDFIKDVIAIRKQNQNRNQRFALICDNASIHSSIIMSTFAKESKLPIITISPYWPCLNPCEHVINAIKSKVKKQLNNNQ